MAALCTCENPVTNVCRACKQDFIEVVRQPFCMMYCLAHSQHFQHLKQQFVNSSRIRNPGSARLGHLCETCSEVFKQKYIDADRGYELLSKNHCEKIK